MAGLSAGLVVMVMLSNLLICLQQPGVTATRPDKHILGGHDAKRGQFPWQVLVYSVSRRAAFVCGGSVIDPHWVLTAGHCIHEGNMVLKFGSLSSNITDKSEAGCETVVSNTHFVHENFTKFNVPNENGFLAENDIAVIRLKKPLRFSSTIRPVKLPRRSQQSKTFEGEDVICSGWGNTEFPDREDRALETNDFLKYADLRTGSYKNCMANHFICTIESTSESALRGDSGGPLVWKDNDGDFVQIGIVSQLGGGYKDGDETGPFLFANAFVFLPYYLAWIEDNTGIMIDD